MSRESTINAALGPFGVLLFMSLLLFSRTAESQQVAYDPLAVTRGRRPEPLELTVTEAARKREIPIRVYLPLDKTAVPVVLFSHGLGGSREGSVFLGKRWAARGYVCVFLQHPGSDTSVWKDKPPAEAAASLRKAMNLENFILRAKDVSATLDQLQRWNQQGGHPLYGRLDMKRVGMSGHSFGAATTQAVSGQVFPTGTSFTDPRIKAAIIFSPSSPQMGTAKDAFGEVKNPWMLMTGTKDVVPLLSRADVKSRLAVYAALPPGGKYELVLDRGEHSIFTDRRCPATRSSAIRTITA